MKDRLDRLRKTLGTTSLRKWLWEEFPGRTKILLNSLGPIIEYAYTTPNQYTVNIVDPSTGEEEVKYMTEAELRAEYGDLVANEAMGQLSEKGNARVNIDDIEYNDIPEELLDDWAAWGFPGAETWERDEN